MGCWCSVSDDGEYNSGEFAGYHSRSSDSGGRFSATNPLTNIQRQYYRTNNYYHTVSSLATAMHRAEQTAAAIAGVPNFSLSAQAADLLVRKAKADGSTVKVIEDRLYIDYKYIGRMPRDDAYRH